ncbi:MAG TPA: glycosyltransferase family 39 protein [Methylomirabilota bacterium]|nr:glycosyltransferase family 39 protein [Methylomirabilota bacterium]
MKIKKIPGSYIVLILTTCLALISFSWNINSWKFSYIGDEWTFYTFAQDIVRQHFLINPFSMQGVYGENPVLGSIYQAFFLKFFGDSNFSWRLSNSILIIPASIFFFLWVKKLFNENTALLSTLLLQSSFYISNYFKIGYVNPQAFTLFLISLYAASLVGESPTRKHMLFLGICLGLSFYIYIGPLFPFFVCPLLLPLLKKKTHVFTSYWLYLLTPYLVLLLPGLFDLQHWHTAAKKTIFFKEFHDNSQIIINIMHNFLLYYKNYDIIYNHFIAGAYLDVISGILAFIGSIIVVVNFRKKSYGLFLLTYLSVIFVIALTSPYAYAPTTRGIFFIPFGCIFAGISLSLLFQYAYFRLAVAILLIGIFTLNLYQSQIGVFKQTGYSQTALVLKELFLANHSPNKTVSLLLSSDQLYNFTDIFTLQEAYGLTKVHFSILPADYLQDIPGSDINALYFDDDKNAKKEIKYFVSLEDKQISFKELSTRIY